jgi:hypothetical protein
MKSKSSVPPALMHSLLASVVFFMSRSGMDLARIESSFKGSMRAAKARRRIAPDSSQSPTDIGSDTAAGAVLRAWHRDKGYIDEEARPVPLKMSGGPRSLAILMKRQDPECNVGKLAEDMLAVGLIRKMRNGSFMPTAASAMIGQLHPLAIEHVAKSVARLLETVHRNTDSTLTTTPLIERYAHVPDLDSAEASEFAAFAQQQGSAYLESIDDWLESRRLQSKDAKKRRPSTKVAAGVHLVAYLGDQPPA